MKKRQKTVCQYLKLYQHSEYAKLKLLGQSAMDIGREDRPLGSVVATWMISFKHVKLENPRAADILLTMSFLDRQEVPITLLTKDNEHPVDFDEAIGILESYAFVFPDETGSMYNMHRLVHITTRAWLNAQDNETATKIASQTMQTLSSRFPDGEFESWATCAQYLPHADAILNANLPPEAEQPLARAKLLEHVSWYLALSAKSSLEIAMSKAEEGLAIYLSMNEDGSAEALRLRRRIAAILLNQGDMKAATSLLRETLAAQEALLGANHTETLETASILSCAIYTTTTVIGTESCREAEILGRRVLSARQDMLPRNHPKVLESVAFLGQILIDLKESDEAETLLREAATQREAVLGEFHPNTAISYSLLAQMLSGERKFEEAEFFTRRATTISETLLGSEHSSTIIISSQLGSILVALGRPAEGETVQRRQLALSTRTLGRTNPVTISCICGLSYALRDQEKYADDEKLLREAISERPEMVQNNDGFILILMRSLGQALTNLERYEESQLYLSKALAGFKHVIHEEYNEEILFTTHKLAYATEMLDQLSEAEAYFRTAWYGRQRLHGDDSHLTLTSSHALGRVFRKQEKHKEAVEVCRYVHRHREVTLGKDDKATLLSCDGMGDSLLALGRFEEAEAAYRRVLEGRAATLGEADESIMTSMEDLMTVLFKQNKDGEVEEVCRHLLDVRKKYSGQNLLAMLRSLYYLASSLHNQGKEGWVDMFQEVEERYGTLAEDCMKEKKWHEAARYWNQAWYAMATTRGIKHPYTVILRANEAVCRDFGGEYEEAEDLFRKALRSGRKCWESTTMTPCS
jgi:tetratricopeptide (TPR) repeat protein